MSQRLLKHINCVENWTLYHFSNL